MLMLMLWNILVDAEQLKGVLSAGITLSTYLLHTRLLGLLTHLSPQR